MTSQPFGTVARAISGDRIDPAEVSSVGAPHRRLLDAIVGRDPVRTGDRDLVALVRQVLRYESEHQGVSQQLRIPRQNWPAEALWVEAGCRIEHSTSESFTLSAHPWRPDWLTGGLGGVGVGAEAALQRRPDLRVPGDPFLEDTLGARYDAYSSEGQKQAIRTVMAARPGSTVLVNLPTGSGKSAVALVPALLRSHPVGVSVVVVPTTSLALDQERAATDHLASTGAPSPGLLAYHSELQDGEKQAIKDRIRGGTQRLVFTSPESLVQSLAPALYDAGRSGHIRLLAIDEAHTVATWGVDFRPEFQALSGFRRDLLRVVEEKGHDLFTTVLLSATITEESAETLLTLFGEPGPVEVVHSTFVRPEPEYWISSADSEDERLDRILESARHIPRPAIIYTTQPSQANEVANRLRADGHRRVAVVTGQTNAAGRLQAIRDWRGAASGGGNGTSTVDIIVGTSAFGLGVDQSDVRSVIHACLPENIDRYYQEVGRGGRDGHAALALMIHSPADRAIARQLSATQVIGVELGLERWKAMVLTSEDLPGSRLRVSLDARHGGILRGSSENEAWNLRTLSLMMRAGMIRLDSQPPPQAAESLSDHRLAELFEQYYTSAVVEIRDPDHLEEARWTEVVEPTRQNTIRSSHSSHQKMIEVTTASCDIADLLVDAYRISAGTTLGTSGAATVQPACGGCDSCRRNGRPPYFHPPSSPEAVRFPNPTISEALGRFLDPAGAPLLVTFDPTRARSMKRWRELNEIVEVLVRHGIRMICATPTMLQESALRTAHRHVRDGYVFLEADPMTLFAPRVAMLTIPDPARPRAVLPHRYFARPSRPHPRIVLAASDARDPERPDREAVELRHPNVEIDTLLAVL